MLKPLFPTTAVRVSLVMDTDTKKVSLEVSVGSNAKRYLWGHMLVDADQDLGRLKYQVQQAAEKIANHQCAKYGDTHNPPTIAKAAMEAFEDIWQRASKAKVGVSSLDTGTDVGA